MNSENKNHLTKNHMSSHNDPNINPFAELFNDAQPNISLNKHLLSQQDAEDVDSDDYISNKLEEILHVSLNPDSDKHTFLSQLYVDSNNQRLLNEQNLGQAIFERLLLNQNDVQKCQGSKDDWEILIYLYECFERIHQEINETVDVKSRFGKLKTILKDSIICNSATALQSPDLYGQNIASQFNVLLYQLYTSSKNKHLNEYLVSCLNYVYDNFGIATLITVCTPILSKMKDGFAKMNLIDSTLFDSLDSLQFFIQTPYLCQVLITYSTPDFLNKLDGKAYVEPLQSTSTIASNPSAPLNSSNSNSNNNTNNPNNTTLMLNAFREAFDRGLRNVNLPPNFSHLPNGARNNNLNNTATPNYGKQFEETLLGKALNISCIPSMNRNNRGASLFFNNVSQLSRQEHKNMEHNLWKPLSSLVDKLYQIFYAFLKADPQTKHLTLKWIGYCIYTNLGRAKIWSTELPEVFAATFASDSFMLNLGAILLRLSKPFSYPNAERMLKLDSRYSKNEPKSDEDAKNHGKHMIGLSKETCLVTCPEGSSSDDKDVEGINLTFNFITECSFMTAKCLDIGFRVIMSKYLKMNQELGRLQNYYESAVSSGGTMENNPALKNIKDAMEKGLSIFLSTKAALLEPVFLETFFFFCVAFCQYLCHEIYVLNNSFCTGVGQSTASVWDNLQTCFTPPGWAYKVFYSNHNNTVTPVSEINSAGITLNGGPREEANNDLITFLSRVPEFFLENIFDLMMLLSHFSDESLEYYGQRALESLLIMVLTLMGSPDRVKNPHLRAKMAETLEGLIPVSAKKGGNNNNHDEDDDSLEYQGYSFNNRNWSLNSPQDTNVRSQLFKLESAVSFGFDTSGKVVLGPNCQSSYVNFIFPILIHVFVSIEETGQNVAFEQKFSYRRPMYVVLKYLWKNPEHRKIAKMMADEAEKNIEAINPPLFLRFINLLMNDAIFLLDEALSFMNQIREMQLAKDNGEWEKLTPEQKQEKENSFQHLGLMARYHNVLGLETIRVIDYMTRYIYTIFTHPTLVTRIASMLNYFLLHLVGPKKKNFKVKDLTAYEFKPPDIVTTICQIYVNLGNTVDSFKKNSTGIAKHEYFVDKIDEYGNKKKSMKTLDDKETINLMKESEESFCRAVSLDGRSYSSELFTQAQDVLYKIGNKAASSYSSFNTYNKASTLSSELETVAKKVKNYAIEQELEDEIVGDAPDEYLDPIMSTLMLNPVILPTSGKVVDRSTIARHLLSDQSDPFNRLPLTMDMIKSDTELKGKIDSWRSSKNVVSVPPSTTT